ncbi:DNA glycosylase [Aspergillus campestris IBT 28561]|uniref:DNA glycosylase n=1 Tax=Aspergillus campestris (strain IBT 28561) TaxID=1392248 RepID=A0A2I1DA56_ASPC2|nr:DNA glycosylase [Aspergillus campestris IBT 28561]PKY06765.1 DNA glycosylase [Aspergillus campestris IBT 28561]
MERRATRSSARQAALRAAGLQDVKPDIMSDGAISRRKSRRESLKAGSISAKAEQQRAAGRSKVVKGSAAKKRKTSPAKKRKMRGAVEKMEDGDELPHNLGSISKATGTGALPHNRGSTPALQSIENKNNHKPLSNPNEETPAVKVEASVQESADLPSQTKNSKKSNTYGLTPGVSPFPDWNRCGEVPSVLDALIRTLLSGATTGANSALAFSGLVQKFGLLDHGIGKGSVDWDAVRRASLQDVFEAIKSGGLAAMKSKNIKTILDMVYEENQLRRAILVKGEEDATSDLGKKSTGGKLYEIACADQNFLSLNHLHDLPTEDAMTALVKYPGIGPKTAACVLLFCLQRPCFAVDTHIFRICKWLGWVPPTKATEITAFSHLEVRIPDRLKYSLHQLLIRHGKTCPRCRAITGQSSARWDEGCVIDHLVKRTGKRKG